MPAADLCMVLCKQLEPELQRIYDQLDDPGKKLHDEYVSSGHTKTKFLKHVKKALADGVDDQSFSFTKFDVSNRSLTMKIVCGRCVGFPKRGREESCPTTAILVRTKGRMRGRCPPCTSKNENAKSYRKRVEKKKAAESLDD